jgi:hypothetical protein
VGGPPRAIKPKSQPAPPTTPQKKETPLQKKNRKQKIKKEKNKKEQSEQNLFLPKHEPLNLSKLKTLRKPL